MLTSLFGPTRISTLEKVKSIEIEAPIKPSDASDRYGCGDFSINFASKDSEKSILRSGSSLSRSNKVVDNEEASIESRNKVISIVQRGDCTFQEKSFNKKVSELAEGVIVINNNKGDDLFVMSGGGSEELANLDIEEYPVTVLVTWHDGQEILKMMSLHEENSDAQIKARISLVHDQLPSDTELTDGKENISKFWPRVKASSDALQIYSHSGWGIHAVQMFIDDKNGDVKAPELQWQLYILKHDMVEKFVP